MWISFFFHRICGFLTLLPLLCTFFFTTKNKKVKKLKGDMQEKLLFRITRTSPIVNHNYCNPLHFSCSLFSPFFLFIHLKYDWKVVNIYNNNKNNKRVCWKWKLKEKKTKVFIVLLLFFPRALFLNSLYFYCYLTFVFIAFFVVVVVAFYNSPLTSIFVSAISLAKTIFFCFSIKRGIGLRTFTLMSNHVVNLKYK